MLVASFGCALRCVRPLLPLHCPHACIYCMLRDGRSCKVAAVKRGHAAHVVGDSPRLLVDYCVLVWCVCVVVWQGGTVCLPSFAAMENNPAAL